MFNTAKRAYLALMKDDEGDASWLGIILVVVVVSLVAVNGWGGIKSIFFTDYEALRIEELEQARLDDAKKAEQDLDTQKAETERKEKLRKQFHDGYYNEKKKRERTEKELAELKELMKNEKFKAWLMCGYPAELDAHRVR